MKPKYLDFNPLILKKGDDNITTKATYPSMEFRPGNIVAREEVQKCPECNSTDLVVDNQRAEVYCKKCGSVLDENLIDQGPEWRAFDTEQRNSRSRVGAPINPTYHDGGLPTVIGKKNRDYNGRAVPERNQAQMYRIRKLQQRSRVSGAGERNLALALGEIHRTTSNLSLPRNVKSDASFIYRNAAKKNIIRGRSIEGVVAASVYAACRRCEIPRTLEEISEATKISRKKIGKTYRFLSRELKFNLKPTSPEDYVPRFATKIKLSKEAESKAISIIKEASKKGLIAGKAPAGVAAAALYIASVLLGERKTQKEVANASGVTEVTIRNTYKKFSEQLDGFTL